MGTIRRGVVITKITALMTRGTKTATGFGSIPSLNHRCCSQAMYIASPAACASNQPGGCSPQSPSTLRSAIFASLLCVPELVVEFGEQEGSGNRSHSCIRGLPREHHHSGRMGLLVFAVGLEACNPQYGGRHIIQREPFGRSFQKNIQASFQQNPCPREDPPTQYQPQSRYRPRSSR